MRFSLRVAATIASLASAVTTISVSGIGCGIFAAVSGTLFVAVGGVVATTVVVMVVGGGGSVAIFFLVFCVFVWSGCAVFAVAGVVGGVLATASPGGVDRFPCVVSVRAAFSRPLLLAVVCAAHGQVSVAVSTQRSHHLVVFPPRTGFSLVMCREDLRVACGVAVVVGAFAVLFAVASAVAVSSAVAFAVVVTTVGCVVAASAAAVAAVAVSAFSEASVGAVAGAPGLGWLGLLHSEPHQ